MPSTRRGTIIARHGSHYQNAACGPAITLSIDQYPDHLTLLDLLATAYSVPIRLSQSHVGRQHSDEMAAYFSGRGDNPWWNRINFAPTVCRIQALQSRGEFPNVVLQGNFQVPLPENVRQDIFAYYDALRAIQVVDAER